MQSVTWQELLDYIVESDVDLNSEVVLYDGSTGEESECTLLEVSDTTLNKINKQVWYPVLTFNTKDIAEVE